MKDIAEFIRNATPGITDEERHRVVSFLHTWFPVVSLLLLVFTESVIFKLIALVFLVAVIVTEIVYRDCIWTQLEKEFSDKSGTNLGVRLLQAFGWEISKSEKLTFNIGFACGLLVMTVLMLLRESALWMLGITGIGFTALQTLMWSSITHPILRISLPPLSGGPHSPILSASVQTPLPVSV